MSAFAAVMFTISSIRPANITSFNMASLHHWWPVLPRLPLKRCELRHSQSRPMQEVDKTGTGSGLPKSPDSLAILAAIRCACSRLLIG